MEHKVICGGAGEIQPVFRQPVVITGEIRAVKGCFCKGRYSRRKYEQEDEDKNKPFFHFFSILSSRLSFCLVVRWQVLQIF